MHSTRTTHRLAAVVLATALTGTACSTIGDTGGSDASPSDTVVLVTHESFDIGKEQLAAFEEQTGLTVDVDEQGDAGSLVNQLVLTKDAPLGDAVFGIDNAFASRALDAGVLEPGPSTATGELVDGLALEDDRLTPVDYGDVCVNVDDAWFAARDLEPPRTLEDLTDPRYEDLLVVTDPATSSPGLAFLLGTIDAFGDDWPDYWARLRDNGLEVAGSWSNAYFVDFTAGGGDGPRPLVLSYASSPPYTVPKGEDEPTTSALLDTCFRQVEYAGVLAGSANPEGAQQLVDFLLSEQVQEVVPEEMYVYPALAAADLPPDWRRHAPLAEDPYTVSPDDIDANREEWIEQWSATVVG